MKRNCLFFPFRYITVILALLISLHAQSQVADDYTQDDEVAQQYFEQKWEGDSILLYKRNMPAEKIKKLKEDDNFWYADKEFTRKEKQQELKARNEDYVPLLRRSWFQTLLWLVIIGAFAAAVMWFLASGEVGLFRKRSREMPAAGDDEAMPEDIFAINYQKEIDKAAGQGNYRLATRLMFLRLLKNMAERNIIRYKQDRTNLDYLFQLQGSQYYDGFFRITRDYEYAWYGLFDVNEEAYAAIRSDFNRFERMMG